MGTNIAPASPTAERIYTNIPPGAPLDVVRGLEGLDQAMPGYEEARAYYDGDITEFFEFTSSNPRLQQQMAQTSLRYRFRLAKTPVTALAPRLRIASVSVPDNPEATKRIEQIRKANNMAVAESDLIVDTLVDGDGYMVAWPYEDDPEDNADDELAAAGVEVSYNSPRCVRVLYDADHPGRKAFAIKRWQEWDEEGRPSGWRVDLYYSDRLEPWFSKDHKPGQQLGTWFEYELEESEPTQVDGGEIPVFHCRTASPYGVPVHKDAYGPQDAINKSIITQLTTMDAHGWPHRFRLLEPGAELDNNSDDPDWDDDAAPTSSHQGGASTSARNGPGTEDVYTGTKQVGQHPAADLAAFNDPIELYTRLMAFTTGTPLHYFPLSGQQPSGLSRLMEDAPLNDKAEGLKRRMEGPLGEMWRYILRLVDIDVEEVVIEWAPPGLVMDKEFWEVAGLKTSMGVPLKQVLLEAGYTPDQVEEFLGGEDTTPPPPPAVEDGTDGSPQPGAADEDEDDDTGETNG